MQAKPRQTLTPALIITLAMLSAFAPISIDLYLPAFPTIQAEFGTTASLVQLSLSAFMLAFGFGQVVYGPLSDHFGRKPVLIAGILLYSAASIACMFAHSAPQLIGLRFIQGLAACAPPVMARAMVRDLAERDQAARAMSLMMVASSVAPIIGPFIGSQIMAFFSWHAIFTTLSLVGLASLGLGLFVVRESLRPELRGPLDFLGILARFAELLRSRLFMGYALTGAFLFGAMFSFLSVSSFILIGVYGLSPSVYSYIFGSIVLSLTIGAFANSRLAPRFGAETMLRRATWAPLFSGIALITCGIIESQTGALGWPIFAVLTATLVAGMSFIAPNSAACALQRYPHMAGTASSLLGVIQFGCAAIFGALAGATLGGTILPMALFMGVGGIGSFTIHRLLVARTAAS